MKHTITNQLAVMPPGQTTNFIQEAGLKEPVEFFQAFLKRAWHAQKSIG